MESKKKMLFIFNPFSGKAQIKSKLFEIIDVFVKGGYEVIVHPTQAVGDGFEKTKELAPQVDLVVCSGGDGTLDEVVSGLMEVDQRVPIGYIPAGSTNDFANSLSISKDMVQAAKDIIEGNLYSCDVGAFNNDSFVYIAAFGLFTDVSYETDQHMKNILGHCQMPCLYGHGNFLACQYFCRHFGDPLPIADPQIIPFGKDIHRKTVM